MHAILQHRSKHEKCLVQRVANLTHTSILKAADSESRNCSTQRLISGFSCRTTSNKELWTSICWSLYWTKPNSRNLFMKKLTRDRVVPIISASVSWLIFAMIGTG